MGVHELLDELRHYADDSISAQYGTVSAKLVLDYVERIGDAYDEARGARDMTNPHADLIARARATRYPDLNLIHDLTDALEESHADATRRLVNLELAVTERDEARVRINRALAVVERHEALTGVPFPALRRILAGYEKEET